MKEIILRQVNVNLELLTVNIGLGCTVVEGRERGAKQAHAAATHSGGSKRVEIGRP
jgi:hypothetical protein